MRSTVLTYLNANTVSGFSVSSQLPFNQNGEALYLQNLKTIYVDQQQTEQDPLYDTLDDSAIVEETTTVNLNFKAIFGDSGEAFLIQKEYPYVQTKFGFKFDFRKT